MEDFTWVETIDQKTAEEYIKNKTEKYNPELTDEIFNEVRSLVTKIWSTYDNKFGYVDGKMEEVNSLPKNSWDSVIRMLTMFHPNMRNGVILPNLSSVTKEPLLLKLHDENYIL